MRKGKNKTSKREHYYFAVKPPTHFNLQKLIVNSLGEDHTSSVPWFDLSNYAKLLFRTTKCSQNQ